MTTVIQTTLELVRQKLNESLRNADPVMDDWVILSNIADHAGRPYEPAQNKIVMILAGIQQETTITNLPPARRVSEVAAPTLYVDLFVLFLANFYDGNYPAGLGMISETISFFQQHPVFTPDNLPGLDPAIDKLTFEMNNLALADLNDLMQMIGAKYLPSVYYRVRMIPFTNEALPDAADQS